MRSPKIVLSFAFLLLVGPVAGAGEARTEICATGSLGMKQTPALEKFHQYLDADHVGLVNETQGSYVVLDFLSSKKMTVSFYTSGLFALMPVKREGPVEFCDLDGELRMRGIERDQLIKIVDGKLVIDEGGPKKTFVKGAMPAKLATLHNYVGRSIASDPRGPAPRP